MRVRDVRVGDTYLVEVPHQLPPSRYPVDPLNPNLWWRLAWLRGARFRLSVTSIDRDADPPVVEGVRVVAQPFVVVDLTDEQIDDLGLPPGRYQVEGVLYDNDHQAVDLPEVESMQVPVRWLHPADAARPPTHRDIDQQRW